MRGLRLGGGSDGPCGEWGENPACRAASRRCSCRKSCSVQHVHPRPDIVHQPVKPGRDALPRHRTAADQAPVSAAEAGGKVQGLGKVRGAGGCAAGPVAPMATPCTQPAPIMSDRTRWPPPL